LECITNTYLKDGKVPDPCFVADGSKIAGCLTK